MKRFLELTEEQNKKLTMLFGRMNPPTKGHEENVEGLKKMAAKDNSDHLVIASHSVDAKKNPLSPDVKLKHLKRAFPDTNITTSSKEKPTIMHHAADAYKKGYSKGISYIIINNYHLKYSQLIIELKNPRGTGTLSDAQENYLSSMVLNDAKIIVSNDYDYIVHELYEYFKDVRVICHLCNRTKKFYTSVSNLNKHIECFHNRIKK